MCRHTESTKKEISNEITVKPEKNTRIKFHENTLKQFSRRLKFTNLASEPQKFLTYLLMFPECIIKVIH